MDELKRKILQDLMAKQDLAQVDALKQELPGKLVARDERIEQLLRNDFLNKMLDNQIPDNRPDPNDPMRVGGPPRFYDTRDLIRRGIITEDTPDKFLEEIRDKKYSF